MVRPREIKGFARQVNLNLETKLYEEFENLLPRHKSVSQAIREYMRSTVDESKKVEALARLPILNQDSPRQTTITEYDIKLFQRSEERMEKLSCMDKQTLTIVAIDVLHLQNQIRVARSAKPTEKLLK
jgi:metal-responsive CopG/Arc/MetJ family transcriptional regulator